MLMICAYSSALEQKKKNKQTYKCTFLIPGPEFWKSSCLPGTHQIYKGNRQNSGNQWTVLATVATSLHSMSRIARCFSAVYPNKPNSFSVLKTSRNAFENSEITQHAFKGIEGSQGEEKGLSMPVLSKRCQKNTPERPLALSLFPLLTQNP